MTDKEHTALGIELAVAERDLLEDEIVALDSSVAQTNEKIKGLDAERKLLSENYDFQWRMRQTKLNTREKLDGLIRDLKRDREGFPWLNDEEYEDYIHDAHMSVEEIIGWRPDSPEVRALGL